MLQTLSHSLRHKYRCLAVLAITIIGLIVQSGCQSYPKPNRTYEYVERYDRMSDSMDPILSLVYFSPNVSMSEYKGCIVGNIAVGGEWVEDQKVGQAYATYLRMLLVQELEKLEAFEKVTLDPNEDVPSPAMRIEGMCTVFDTGSGTQRFFSYFLPFLQKGGATDLQVEGRIYNVKSGELIMEFVDRRRHLGNTPWLPNPGTFSDKFVMKHTVWEVAHSLALVLSGSRQEIAEDIDTIQQKETQ
ncbi:MAG: hypothetical protein ACOC0A_02630 [Planctomycetota bacterium]